MCDACGAGGWSGLIVADSLSTRQYQDLAASCSKGRSRRLQETVSGSFSQQRIQTACHRATYTAGTQQPARSSQSPERLWSDTTGSTTTWDGDSLRVRVNKLSEFGQK